MRYYLLKIVLIGSKPEIWRRFLITLDRLHDVIQIIMGWQDRHLHEFKIRGQLYTENPETKEDGLQEYHYSLATCLRNSKKIHYLYDFGDNW